MTPDEAKLLTILHNHAGLARAISVTDVSERMGYGRDKNGTRRVQELKRALVELGYPIGSSTARHGGGYYLATTDGELRATTQQYAHRFTSLGKLLKTMKGMLAKPEPAQQSLTWGE